MFEQVGLEGERVPTLLVALALLSLSAWLNFMRRPSTVHRAFALLLFLRGVLLFTAAFTGRSTLFVDFQVRVGAYFVLAIPYAAAYFAFVAWRRPDVWVTRRRTPADTWVPVSLALLAVTTLAVYANNRNLFLSGPGPLYAFFPLETISYVLIAALFLHSARQTNVDSRRRSHRVLSLGFTLSAAYFATFQSFVGVPTQPQSTLTAYAFWLMWAAAAAGVVAIVVHQVIIAARARQRRERVDAGRYAVWATAALTTGLLVGAANYYAWGTRQFELRIWFDAIWTLGFVFAVAYAILRHRLFDIDVKIRWTVRQGTIGGAFAAAFFVVGEALESVIPVDGFLLGLGAAGFIALGLGPLRRLADRVAARVVPDATRSRERPLDERVGLYEEQARLAWSDGAMGYKERALLDQLRAHLGLSTSEAAACEQRARIHARSANARAATGPAGAPRASS